MRQNFFLYLSRWPKCSHSYFWSTTVLMAISLQMSILRTCDTGTLMTISNIEVTLHDFKTFRIVSNFRIRIYDTVYSFVLGRRTLDAKSSQQRPLLAVVHAHTYYDARNSLSNFPQLSSYYRNIFFLHLSLIRPSVGSCWCRINTDTFALSLFVIFLWSTLFSRHHSYNFSCRFVVLGSGFLTIVFLIIIPLSDVDWEQKGIRLQSMRLKASWHGW